jgi:hypothetical protein
MSRGKYGVREAAPARRVPRQDERGRDEGLYRAEYSGEINPENSNQQDIPDYHLGTSIAEVKIWVEQMALGLGYKEVTWDELPGG